MRSVSQNNADPSKPYMAQSVLPAPQELDKELEHCTVHFVHHFADGLAVIAHNHPDYEAANYAASLHYHIAEELFHFVPESRDTFILRHRDKVNGGDAKAHEWEARAETARSGFMDSVLSRFDSLRG